MAAVAGAGAKAGAAWTGGTGPKTLPKRHKRRNKSQIHAPQLNPASRIQCTPRGTCRRPSLARMLGSSTRWAWLTQAIAVMRGCRVWSPSPDGTPGGMQPASDDESSASTCFACARRSGQHPAGIRVSRYPGHHTRLNKRERTPPNGNETATSGAATNKDAGAEVGVEGWHKVGQGPRLTRCTANRLGCRTQVGTGGAVVCLGKGGCLHTYGINGCYRTQRKGVEQYAQYFLVHAILLNAQFEMPKIVSQMFPGIHNNGTLLALHPRRRRTHRPIHCRCASAGGGIDGAPGANCRQFYSAKAHSVRKVTARLTRHPVTRSATSRRFFHRRCTACLALPINS